MFAIRIQQNCFRSIPIFIFTRLPIALFRRSARVSAVLQTSPFSVSLFPVLFFYLRIEQSKLVSFEMENTESVLEERSRRQEMLEKG